MNKLKEQIKEILQNFRIDWVEPVNIELEQEAEEILLEELTALMEEETGKTWHYEGDEVVIKKGKWVIERLKRTQPKPTNVEDIKLKLYAKVKPIIKKYIEEKGLTDREALLKHLHEMGQDEGGRYNEGYNQALNDVDKSYYQVLEDKWWKTMH